MEYAAEKAVKYNEKFPDFKITPQFVLGFEDTIKRAEVEKADIDATDADLAGDVRVKNDDEDGKKPKKKAKNVD